MKFKPIINAVETAANVVIVAGAAKSVYDKFTSSKKEGNKADDEN